MKTSLSSLKTLYRLTLTVIDCCKLITILNEYSWMNYLTKDKRDVFIYDFESKTKTLVVSFTNKDGLISHMKFLGDFLYYVRNTKDVIVSTHTLLIALEV